MFPICGGGVGFGGGGFGMDLFILRLWMIDIFLGSISSLDVFVHLGLMSESKLEMVLSEN